MPRTYSYRRGTWRRVPNKKTRRPRASAARRRKPTALTLVKNPSIGGFPKSMFTRLKYVFNGTLNPGAGGSNATRVFKANGLYDIDYTGVATHSQARGFDQWMGIYDHYFVKRSKIAVEFHNGDSTYEVNVGIALRDDVSTEATTLEYQEQESTQAMLGRVGSSNNHKKLYKTFNYKRENFAKYTTEENKGSASQDPNEQTHFHLWCGSPWGQDSANTYFTAIMYFDVLFTELKDMAES